MSKTHLPISEAIKIRYYPGHADRDASYQIAIDRLIDISIFPKYEMTKPLKS